MEKDIHRFISRIAELEREKDALNKEIERRKKLETIKKEAVATPVAAIGFNTNTATPDQLRTKVSELIKENGKMTHFPDGHPLRLRVSAQLGNNLKGEQLKATELESQLSDYKQVISQSDDQKLIVMASKVEALTNQLREAQNRIDMVSYQSASTSGTQNAGDRKYEVNLMRYPGAAGAIFVLFQELLKERVDILERALAEEKAKSKSGGVSSKEGSVTGGDSSEKEQLAAEVNLFYMAFGFPVISIVDFSYQVAIRCYPR